MDSDDLVAPGDAALHELLASMAEHTNDAERRDRLLDYMITVPPMADWSPEALESLQETCQYIQSLARLSRELRQLTEGGGESDAPR